MDAIAGDDTSRFVLIHCLFVAAAYAAVAAACALSRRRAALLVAAAALGPLYLLAVRAWPLLGAAVPLYCAADRALGPFLGGTALHDLI